MCALVGTRAVPCIGWTEQLGSREHFASAPCNIHVLLRRQLQAMQRVVHMGQGTAAQGSRAFSAAVPSPEFPHMEGYRGSCDVIRFGFFVMHTNLHTHTYTQLAATASTA